MLSEFFRKILLNSHKIPHDKKFPYLTWFKEAEGKVIANKKDLSVTKIIKKLNKTILKNSNRRLASALFSSSYSSSVGTAASAITIAGGAVSPFLPGSAAIPALGNIIYGFLKKGGELNRDIEGRSYLLKYFENICALMIGDLQERIDKTQDVIVKGDLQKKLDEIAKTLWNFNKIHYKKQPFYYKWVSQSFRQGLSNLISGARLGVAIAGSVLTFIAPPIGLGLIGALIVSEAAGSYFYRKSHKMRAKSYEKNAQDLDECFAGIFDIYNKLGYENIADLEQLELINPIKSRENLNKLMQKIKPNEYQEFLSRSSHNNHGHHHHHHHHIEDRYFGGICSHHTNQGISEENINFRDLSNVNVTSENGELKLPFPTHTHLPFLNKKPFLQAANLVEGTLERSAKILTNKSKRKNRIIPEESEEVTEEPAKHCIPAKLAPIKQNHSHPQKIVTY